jgi:hypothetical protein
MRYWKSGRRFWRQSARRQKNWKRPRVFSDVLSRFLSRAAFQKRQALHWRSFIVLKAACAFYCLVLFDAWSIFVVTQMVVELN